MDLKEAQNKLNAATTKPELYEIAGCLNNRPEHIHTDKVSFLALCDLEYAKWCVQTMINQSMGK